MRAPADLSPAKVRAALAAKSDREVLEELAVTVARMDAELAKVGALRERLEREIEKARSRVRLWARGRGLL